MRESEKEIKRINALARSRGLSYGKLVAQMALEEQAKKPPEEPAGKKREK